MDKTGFLLFRKHNYSYKISLIGFVLLSLLASPQDAYLMGQLQPSLDRIDRQPQEEVLRFNEEIYGKELDLSNEEIPGPAGTPFGNIQNGEESAIVGPVIVHPLSLPNNRSSEDQREIPIGYADSIKLKAFKKWISGQSSFQSLPSDAPGADRWKHDEQTSIVTKVSFKNLFFNKQPFQTRSEHWKPQRIATVGSFSGPGNTGANPPDPTMAAGPNNLLLSVNQSVFVYSKAGAQQLGRSLFDWYSPVGTGGISLFDPWAVYDRSGGRFYLLAAGTSNLTHESYIYLSVSQTNDANGPWCFYRFNAKGGTDNWADYPKIGISSDGVFITANMFAFPVSPSSTFQGYANLWVFGKAAFTACGNPGGGTLFALSGVITVQPALTLDNAPNGYLINSQSTAQYPATNRLFAWTVTCPACNPPTLTSRSFSIGAQGAPAVALQGNGQNIDTSDGRLLNAAFIGGNIWTTHLVGRPNSQAGYTNYLRMYALNPATGAARSWEITASTGSFASIFYFNPSIMPDVNGNATIVFNFLRRSGTFPQVAYKRIVGNVLQGDVLLKAGEAWFTQGPPTGNTYRWGDYAGSSLDPDGVTTWLFNEYVRSDGSWGTWVGAVN